MNTHEQRIAIAEWKGWKPFKGTSIYGTCPNDTLVKELPDYPNDLNAMHEAEKKLTGEQWQRYVDTLLFICGKDCHMFFIYCATSQQRSEALCRTLWPERFEE